MLNLSDFIDHHFLGFFVIFLETQNFGSFRKFSVIHVTKSESFYQILRALFKQKQLVLIYRKCIF